MTLSSAKENFLKRVFSISSLGIFLSGIVIILVVLSFIQVSSSSTQLDAKKIAGQKLWPANSHIIKIKSGDKLTSKGA